MAHIEMGPILDRFTTRLRHPFAGSSMLGSPLRCRRKFLKVFPQGYHDEKYIRWERGYKEAAHQRWDATLNQAAYRSLLRQGEYREIAARALAAEGRTNLLFSYEKMAIRDALRSPEGARDFSVGLYDFLYGRGAPAARFERWCEVVGALPRKGTRVLTWPVVTIHGFLARPKEHIFVKPNVTRTAAHAYGFDLRYVSRPNWETYASVLAFAEAVRRDTRDLSPRDMIDLQSFIWVQGSNEYK